MAQWVGVPRPPGSYRADRAQQRAEQKAALPRVPRRLAPGTPLWEMVVDNLRASLSPEQIAGTLKRMAPALTPVRLSHEAIYQAIYAMPRGELRTEVITLLQREDRLQQIVRLVGPDVLPESQRLILFVAEIVKDGFLALSAFDEKDAYCAPARQVALLCAVCHRPELLLLDEPAGGLDPAARREFLETAIQLLNREGSAILFSSHQMSDVERIGARVVLIERGKVCLDRDLARIREDFCVAMVPRSALRDAAVLERAPGCLRVRSSFDSWHAVFEKPPEEVGVELSELLGVDGVHCVRMPLEDLFVEMVGGQR